MGHLGEILRLRSQFEEILYIAFAPISSPQNCHFFFVRNPGTVNLLLLCSMFMMEVLVVVVVFVVMVVAILVVFVVVIDVFTDLIICPSVYAGVCADNIRVH